MNTRSKQCFALSVHLIFCRTTDEGRYVTCGWQECAHSSPLLETTIRLGRFLFRILFWGVLVLILFFGWYPFLHCLFQNTHGTMTDCSKSRAAQCGQKHRQRPCCSLCAICFSTAFALQLISYWLLLGGSFSRPAPSGLLCFCGSYTFTLFCIPQLES